MNRKSELTPHQGNLQIPGRVVFSFLRVLSPGLLTRARNVLKCFRSVWWHKSNHVEIGELNGLYHIQPPDSWRHESNRGLTKVCNKVCNKEKLCRDRSDETWRFRLQSTDRRSASLIAWSSRVWIVHLLSKIIFTRIFRDVKPFREKIRVCEATIQLRPVAELVNILKASMQSDFAFPWLHHSTRERKVLGQSLKSLLNDVYWSSRGLTRHLLSALRHSGNRPGLIPGLIWPNLL